MIDKNLFFIDAETDGLYGPFITVAIIVTDAQGDELEEYYFGVKKKNIVVTDFWTKENVLPILGNYEELENEEELLQKVWMIWEKHQHNAYAIADVIYPVENRLFNKCVELDLINRKMKGPFPLLDLSSILFAKGLDPLMDRKNFIVSHGKEIPHNALYDVKTEIDIYKKIMLNSVNN